MALKLRHADHRLVRERFSVVLELHGVTCIINPAGFSFQSIPVLDALKKISAPLIEVHLGKIHKREETHRLSKVSLLTLSVICGLGP